jgi:hypothetical protein
MTVDLSDKLVIPKPAYKILRRLTGESRPDVALSLALKDLVRLRLDSARIVVSSFEQKYGASFEQFAALWQAGKIPQANSFAVEQDYWDWEAAASDIQALEEIMAWMA